MILWTSWAGAGNKLLSSQFDCSFSIAFICILLQDIKYLLNFVGILILAGLGSGIL